MSTTYTYMLRCADGTYYTGWTNDLEKRVSVHNQGRGARYTRGRLPVVLLAFWEFDSKSEAMKFEVKLKGLPRPEKERLACERHERHMNNQSDVGVMRVEG